MSGGKFTFKRPWPRRRRPQPEDHEGCYVRLTLRDRPDALVMGFLYGFGAKFWGGLDTKVDTVNLSEYGWPQSQERRLFTYEQSNVKTMECINHHPVPWKRHP